MPEYLFSYGTLQSASVQLKTFGRIPDGKADVLIGYKPSQILITDEKVITATGMTHYNNLLFTGKPTDEINGIVLSLTNAELKLADKYENSANYIRKQIRLKSGIRAWMYVSAANK